MENKPFMVTVDQALRSIVELSKKLKTVSVPIEDAFGHTLSEDVVSEINMPPFDQSAMDGYAISDVESQNFKLVGEIKAGDHSTIELKKGEAVRIFTGAMIPNGASAVAEQEIAKANGQNISIDKFLGENANIRKAGEQIRKDELAIPNGTFLNTGTIGYLAMLGRRHVSVYRKPIVSLITTGNELIKPGKELAVGQIYESNSFMLQAALKNMGIEVKLNSVEDDYQKTLNAVQKAMNESDMVIITGGISVGDYDFVEDVLSELKVECSFYKVKQKPGKPLYFGYKDEKLIFALPGNPAAVLSCFYLYVLPSIQLRMGKQNYKLEKRSLKLTKSYQKTAKMTHFLKGTAKGGEVEILSAQSSAMLSSFTQANCIIHLEEGRETWEEKSQVEVYMLPE